MLYLVLGKKSPLPIKIKIQIYSMYMSRLVLIYTAPAWTLNLPNSNWRRIMVVQNITLRTILMAPIFVSNRTLRNTAGLPLIREFMVKNTMAQFYKKNKYLLTFSTFNYIRGLGRSKENNKNQLNIRPFNWANSQ